MARYKIINQEPINGDYWYYQPILNANGTWRTDADGNILVQLMVVRSIEKEKLEQVLSLLNGSKTLTFAEMEDLLVQMTNLRDELNQRSYVKTQNEIENAIAATGVEVDAEKHDQLSLYIKSSEAKKKTLEQSVTELGSKVDSSVTSTNEALKNSSFPLGKDYRFDPNRGYLAGEVVFYNNKIYQCTNTYSKGTANSSPDYQTYWKEFALASGSVYTKEDIDKFIDGLNTLINDLTTTVETHYKELANYVDKASEQTIPGKKNFNVISASSIILNGYTLTIA